jgi:endonuclease YncB( thermonuclease family)
MEGYDTPEIKSKDIEEKKKAIEARDILRDKILGKYVYIQFGQFCKYGRILGTVYLNKEDIGNRDLSINKFMEQYNKI